MRSRLILVMMALGLFLTALPVLAHHSTTMYNMANPVINGIRTVMFVCGDDEALKPTVLKLATDVGFDAVDAGKLVIARLLEPLAMLWIQLAYNQKMGREFGFALLRRSEQA